MKEGKCFSYKKRGHMAYDYARKEKIAAISEGLSKSSDNQGKE